MPPGDDLSGSFASGIMGTNSLQQAIDKLTEATKSQTAAIQQNSAAQNGGSVTMPAQSQAAAGQTFTSGQFSRSNGGYLSAQYIASNRSISQGGYQPGAAYAAGASGPAIPLSQAGGFPSSNGGYQSNGYRYMGGSTGAPQQYSTVPAVSQPSSMTQSGNGGYGGAVVPQSESNLPATFGGGGSGGGTGSGGGGGFLGKLGGMFGGSVGGAVGGMLGGMAAQGSADLSPQVALNAAYQQAMLGTRPGQANSYNTIYTQMAGWGNKSPNAVSTSAADAAQGFLTLGNLAGSPGNLNGSPLGRAAQSAWSGAGILIPGLGSTGAANVASSVYNPQVSQMMYQMGYGTTPLAPRGSNRGPAGMGQIAQGIFSKWFGGKTPSSQQLAASLSPGQSGYINLQAMGLNPQAMTPILQGYDKLYQQHVSPTKANQLFQQAANGSSLSQINSAQNELTKLGIPKTDFQSIKNLQSQQTARQSEISQGFTSGLDTAAAALEKFNSAINALLNGPLGQAYGYGKGLASGAGLPGSPLHNPLIGGGLGGLAGSLLGGLFKGGGGLLGKGLSKLGGLFGKGGRGVTDHLGNPMSGDGAAFDITDVAAGGGEAAASGASGLLGPAGLLAGGLLYARQSMSTSQRNRGGLAPGSNPVKQVGGGTLNVGAAQQQGFGFADGGRVTAGSFKPGADDVHAMLSRDETVLNAGASRALGYGNIEHLNKRYQAGLKTNMQDGVLHAASGASILSDAKKYQGHKYVWGGPSNPSSGWDCSSFASWVLGHDEGLQLPGGSWASTTQSGAAHGDTAGMFTKLPGAHMVSHDPKDIQAGDVLVWPTHVGFGVGPGTMFSAYGTGSGTIQSPKDMKNAGGPSGETLTIMRYGAGGGVGSASLTSSTTSNKPSTTSGGGALGLDPGSYGSSDDKSNIMSALMGGAGGGGGFQGFSKQNAKGSSGVGAPAGGGTGGAAVYNYLLKNLFGGNKIAAAGATASIWGESGWNPFAVGTGGRGLIGWTPPSKISDSAFAGGMATQLPAIIQFVQQNGDMGVIQQMKQAKDVASAAQLWDHGVERAGINDVHPTGISLATKIAGLATGGDIVVGERGPEVIRVTGGGSASVMNASQTRSLLAGTSGKPAQAPWVAQGMAAYSYAPVPQNSYNNGRGGTGINVTVSVGSGAITINASGGATDISNALSQTLVKQVTDALHHDATIKSIANGSKGNY